MLCLSQLELPRRRIEENDGANRPSCLETGTIALGNTNGSCCGAIQQLDGLCGGRKVPSFRDNVGAWTSQNEELLNTVGDALRFINSHVNHGPAEILGKAGWDVQIHPEISLSRSKPKRRRRAPEAAVSVRRPLVGSANRIHSKSVWPALPRND